MSNLSDYLENEIADHILGGGDYSRPATVYFGLYTAAPSDSGGGTEVSASGYARLAVTNNSTNFPAASGGLKQNGVELAFSTATADWGTVVAFGIFDAASGGNLLFHGSLTTNRAVITGDTPKWQVNAFQIQFD